METGHTPREARAVSELLEVAGNCRQNTNQEPHLRLPSDSLLSEQQKLRHVLDWAHRFLSSGSEVCQEFCRADGLILASEKDEKKRGTEKRSPAYEHSPAEKCCHPGSCSASINEVFEGGSTGKVWQLKTSYYMNGEQNNFPSRYKPPFQDDLDIPFAFTPWRDEVTWPESRDTEIIKSVEPQHNTIKQTPGRDNCRTSGLHISNQRRQTNTSDSSKNETLASDAATGLIKEPASCWSNVHRKKSTVFGAVSAPRPLLKSTDSTDVIYNKAGARSKGEMSEKQNELRREAERMAEVEKEKTDEENDENMHKGQESSSVFTLCANENMSQGETETPGQMANPSFTCHLKIPSNLTVYEQYQLCVDQLHHLRMRQSQCNKSPQKERKTCEETAAPVEAPALTTPGFEFNSTNPETKKHFNEARSRRVTAAEERSSDDINETQGSTTYNGYGATLTEHGESKQCDSLTVKKSRPLRPNNTSNGNRRGALMRRTADAVTSADKFINTPVEHLRAPPDEEGGAAPMANSVLLPKKTERHPSGVRGQRKTSGGRGPRRLCEKSSTSFSSLTHGGILPRSQSAGAIKCTKRLNAPTHTKRHTPGDRVKHTSPHRDTHTHLQPTETHTPHHDDTRTTSRDSGTTAHVIENTDCKYSPAGVSACDRWLRLPDEVWLSILSLLPHSNLCRVAQVCSRLRALATDHTLWKNLRIENSALTERWLLFVGKRRPRSLCLYSCGGLSVTSCGLEMFFTLCRKSLEEVKVTSCAGPGLRGDQILPLIGRLCDRVTSVDVSWSGATDTGVKALSDGSAGLRLKSVVLNGCHVTDDPLKKLALRHKESLCRLEVFGCQSLTPSCLQTIYEMCPGLKHLNIGQVPKVNAHSLTVLASQLRSLISLNLTGLQAVTDATVDTLLQNCVELQSLTLSSCPGVTDLTLRNISKYAPCIRSLDMSGCKAVTDAGVQSLTLGCRKLQQLDLSSTRTGNRGLVLLANYCSGHLHTVKLSFCHITSENILKLCRRCKGLKVLHLYGCAHVPTEREIRDVNTTVKVYPLS